METTTYVAELHSPLFYAASEGTLIRTGDILSSTALSYALGYSLGLLKKRYFLYGKEAYQHQYEELASTELFVTDGVPLNLVYTEETFKSTEYLSERNMTIIAKDEFKNLKDMDLDPDLKRKKVGLNKVRRYIGLAPGSKFLFTVWSREPLPDDLLLTMGIRRSGEVRLKKTANPKTVCLNLFMLHDVYGVPSGRNGDEGAISLIDIYNHASTLVRGSDYRDHHFLDVDVKFVEDVLVPQIMAA
ncbi:MULTISPECIES: hypothetical protein [unclassified Methanoculleus]|uniref:CRISPR-associated protein Csc1 n=1 Tax=Methanoculleus palmolei TaxID=72612 RepID=A0ABD8A6S5_9EURY|nr:hypothetical protein R6Y95_07125 [Methanoculleus palmolei]